MTIKISQLANISAITDTTFIPAVDTSSTFTTVKLNAVTLKNYIGGQNSSDLANLTATTTQANIAMNGYVNYTVSTANIGMIGYVGYSVTTANLGMIGYVGYSVSTANIGMKGYVDYNVSTANIGMKGYVDFANTIQAGAITAANVGMKGYVDQSNVSMKNYVDGQIVASVYRISNNTSNITVFPNSVNVAVSGAWVSTYDSQGNLTVVGNIMPTANNVSNIGSPGLTFNTVFARATTAQYADLAEKYLADAAYAPGTVLEFGGTHEVTLASLETTRVAGVVSTNPAYSMNDGIQGEHITTIALVGRVPTQVTGPIHKGDLMISAGNGYAKATTTPQFGAVIGKALEDFIGDKGIIEVVVGRI